MGSSRFALFFCAGLCLIGLLFWVVQRLRPSLAAVPAETKKDQFAVAAPPVPESPILIKATGHKFFWRFSFCGQDRTFGTRDDLVVDKVLHLPLDSDIRLTVESDDFVYSFHVPELQLRHVAVPGLSYSLDFHTDRPGSYTAVMDPVCGGGIFLSPDQDMGHVVFEPRQDFEAWYLNNYRKSRG